MKHEAQQQAILTTAYRDYEKGLNVYVFFKTRDHAVGDDLVQDTFLKTWAYLVKGGKIEIMKAFLYHVLKHLIVDGYRKHKTTSLDTLLEKGFEPSEDNSGRALDIMDGRAAILLIQQLPEKYRGIMTMRYVKELSLREMSLLTGQTRNTMAVQVHRGLRKLKALYRRS